MAAVALAVAVALARALCLLLSSSMLELTTHVTHTIYNYTAYTVSRIIVDSDPSTRTA